MTSLTRTSFSPLDRPWFTDTDVVSSENTRLLVRVELRQVHDVLVHVLGFLGEQDILSVSRMKLPRWRDAADSAANERSMLLRETFPLLRSLASGGPEHELPGVISQILDHELLKRPPEITCATVHGSSRRAAGAMATQAGLLTLAIMCGTFGLIIRYGGDCAGRGKNGRSPDAKEQADCISERRTVSDALWYATMGVGLLAVLVGIPYVQIAHAMKRNREAWDAKHADVLSLRSRRDTVVVLTHSPREPLDDDAQTLRVIDDVRTVRVVQDCLLAAITPELRAIILAGFEDAESSEMVRHPLHLSHRMKELESCEFTQDLLGALTNPRHGALGPSEAVALLNGLGVNVIVS